MLAQELGATVGSLTHFADRTVAHSTAEGSSGAPGGVMAARSKSRPHVKLMRTCSDLITLISDLIGSHHV